jgi:hypothetical protein
MPSETTLPLLAGTPLDTAALWSDAHCTTCAAFHAEYSLDSIPLAIADVGAVAQAVAPVPVPASPVEDDEEVDVVPTDRDDVDPLVAWVVAVDVLADETAVVEVLAGPAVLLDEDSAGVAGACVLAHPDEAMSAAQVRAIGGAKRMPSNGSTWDLSRAAPGAPLS